MNKTDHTKALDPLPAERFAKVMPQRIRLSRQAGFDLQAVSVALNGLPAVNCARPTKWGNPFRVKDRRAGNYTADEAVNLYEAMVDKGLWRIKIRNELRGKNLACYCKPGDPCHCDVLLEIANK